MLIKKNRPAKATKLLLIEFNGVKYNKYLYSVYLTLKNKLTI